MIDSGSTVSIIGKGILGQISKIVLKSARQNLITASGNKIESLGETELQITIGKHLLNQTFVVVSSLIESCILGVDFWLRTKLI